MLNSIGLNPGALIQGGAWLIDIGLAIVLSILYQRALEQSAPDIALVGRVSGSGRAQSPNPRSRKTRLRSRAWDD